jgi:L-arabinokinase
MAPRSLAVYVSSHGFGHATRVSEVVAGFLERVAGCGVHVRTTAPARLFPLSGGRLRVHAVATDVGMVQPHGLAIDFGATIARLDELEARWDDRLAAEAAWLDEIHAGLVLGDLPPLALAAAAQVGVAGVGLGNFSWDWIYGCYVERDPRFAVHAERAAACYAGARRLYRLPFHAPMTVFSPIVDVPLIARHCRFSRGEARKQLGLPGAGPLVLLSFGGLGSPAIDLSRLAELPRVIFIATEACAHAPPNVLCLDPPPVDYAMLLRAADVVLTKPGWGILAASLVNGVRVLYATRDDFPETPILVDALRAHATAEPVALADLVRGEIGPSLEALLARPVAETELAADGAARVAELLAEDLEA